MSDFAFSLARIGQVALAVADVARAAACYRDILELGHFRKSGELTSFDCAGLRLVLEQSADPASMTEHRRCKDPDGHVLALMQEAPKGGRSVAV